jgi:signal transduction histidine kinase/HAMP domain-containing protein
MQLTLRRRIVLTLLPIFLLMGAIGTAGVMLLLRVGSHIDAILRENYRSVSYMERLNEALERIDSSFNFALAGLEEKARNQYETNWPKLDENIRLERGNITINGELELAQELERLANEYRDQGGKFYALSADTSERREAYHGDGGLLERFGQLKDVAGKIRRMNEANMQQASAQAQRTAVTSTAAFAAALGLAALLAGLLAVQMIRTILRPIKAVTASATAISSGNLDQVMPVVSNDELGRLAEAFNLMSRYLREYRESRSAQLLRAQRTSQATIDSFPDPVLVVDPEGRVEMANPAARRILGVQAPSPGEPPASAWQPPAPLREPLAQALRDDRDYLPAGFDQVILITSDNGEQALLPRIITIRDAQGSALGAAVLLQDVTRLRLLDQVKTNLVATASHELKTPLTSLRMAVHVLLEEAIGPLTPKQLELLLDARENSERLLTVVNSLLDLARLEQGWGKLTICTESPATLLRTAADGIRPQAMDKGVEVTIDAPAGLPPVSIDVERMTHALRNLLDNAIAFTERGGRITLAAVGEAGGVTLSVADTGVGIPAEYLPHIFERFLNIPGQSRESGTGLGLAIVKEIVTAHGGSIQCESQPGVGTVFKIHLPTAHTAGVTLNGQQDSAANSLGNAIRS